MDSEIATSRVDEYTESLPTIAKKIKPPHNEIDERKKNKWDGQGKYIISTLYWEVNANVNGDKIPLIFRLQNTYVGFGKPIDGVYFGGMDIHVPADCNIIVNIDMSLFDGKPLFRLSDSFDVITAKHNELDAPDYYDGWDEDQRMFRAKARTAVSGKPTVKDGFNLNVDIYQGLDDKKSPVWLPVTLDPDVINPKPPF